MIYLRSVPPHDPPNVFIFFPLKILPFASAASGSESLIQIFKFMAALLKQKSQPADDLVPPVQVKHFIVQEEGEEEGKGGVVLTSHYNNSYLN